MCRCSSDVSVGRKVISVSYSSAILKLLSSFLFDNSHSDRCEVISHCGFKLH